MNKEIIAVSFSSITNNAKDVDLNDTNTYFPIYLEYSKNMDTNEAMCTPHLVNSLVKEYTKKNIGDMSFDKYVFNKFGREKVYILQMNQNLSITEERTK